MSLEVRTRNNFSVSQPKWSTYKTSSSKIFAALAILAGMLGATHSAQAQTGTIYDFNPNNGSDGYNAYAGLVEDGQGNLFGTTQNGGAYNGGTVYRVNHDGSESVLYSFTNGVDGGGPSLQQLIVDKGGNLYGTTNNGGAYGLGTVFMVSPAGTETVLYSFGSQPGDGAHPYAGVIRDSKGSLYGTTYNYGASGAGTVFKLSPTGVETILHSFSGGSDGCNPYGSGVVLSKQNVLYGTTSGCGAYGQGIVFEVTQTGVETVLYTFTGGSDGGAPTAGVILDRLGNLCGTTNSGGQNSGGTVFKLTPSGTETVLHSFSCSSTDGCNPLSGLVLDKLGNLYGTTYNGGAYGGGIAFEVTSNGSETVLHNFGSHPTDGLNPAAPLVLGKNNVLYGTTNNGGAFGFGTVLVLVP